MNHTINSWILFVVIVGFGERLFAQESEDKLIAPDLLPKSVVLYASIAPAEKLLDHALTKQVWDSPVVKTLWNSDDLQKARQAVTTFELITAERVEGVARKLTAGGVHLAVDAKTNGVVVLTKTESEKWLRQYLKRLTLIVQNDAKSKNNSDPIEDINYLGFKTHKFQSNHYAALGQWLVVSNNEALIKSIVGRYKDSLAESKKEASSGSFSDSGSFQAWKSLSTNALDSGQIQLAEAFVDLDAMRKFGVAKELLAGKSKDFGGELILGGLLSLLNKTPLASGVLALSPSGLNMTWKIPSDPSWIPESREFFAGPNVQGTAPALTPMPDAIARLSTYRDLSQLWLRAGDLFDQKVNDDLAQADNTLTTLFSGKDFGEDILGAIEPQLQLIVAPQALQTNQLVPAVQLPSFALCGTMKAPLQRDLRRIYQNAIGFLNIVGAMEGNPQMDLQSEKDSKEQAEYTWAEYAVDSDKKYTNGLPIHFNFQPCLAFHGQSVIVSSHIDLARKIVAAQGSPELKTLSASNTLLSVDGASLTKVLKDNREQLISNNILEKGHSRKQAEAETDMLLNILGMLQDLNGSLGFQPESASLSVSLNVKAPE